jgi:hypothetical protein
MRVFVFFIILFFSFSLYTNIYADGNVTGNLCECGACCSDRCSCGKWTGKRCVQYSNSSDGSLGDGGYYSCFHGCSGASCQHVTLPDQFTHCECHHGVGSSGNGNGNGSNDANFTFPELSIPAVPDSSGLPGRLGFSSPSLPDIPNISDLPPVYVPPPLVPFEPPNVPLPPLPTDSIVPPNPSNFSGDYFDYNGGFPEFKFEALFDDFKSVFSDKLDLSSYDRLRDGGTAERLVWNIQHEIFGVRFGPLTIDLTDIISKASSFSGVSVIRDILVFILYTLFVYFIFIMLFFV